MKISTLNRMLVAVVLSAAWLVGMSMAANAQGQRQQEHQQKQNKKQRPQKAQKQQKQQQKGQMQARQQQQRGQNKQQQQSAQRVQRPQSRAVASNHGNNGNNGNHYGRIPDNSYRVHFGHDHSFRMVRPQMVDGYNRFQYSGYWFGFNQPWPSGWSYNDNVYVEYVGGGYYLCDPRHPGIQTTLNLF